MELTFPFINRSLSLVFIDSLSHAAGSSDLDFLLNIMINTLSQEKNYVQWMSVSFYFAK
jgi:hypothetical protein